MGLHHTFDWHGSKNSVGKVEGRLEEIAEGVCYAAVSSGHKYHCCHELDVIVCTGPAQNEN